MSIKLNRHIHHQQNASNMETNIKLILVDAQFSNLQLEHSIKPSDNKISIDSCNSHHKNIPQSLTMSLNQYL